MIRGAALHHVGIVVPRIADALAFYRDSLGLAAGETRDLPGQAVRVAFVGEGSTRIELLEPLDGSSGVARFLAERGRATLHHVCFEVEDLRGALEELARDGYELVDHEPRAGAEGQVAFLHPRAGAGVLVELTARSVAGSM